MNALYRDETLRIFDYQVTVISLVRVSQSHFSSALLVFGYKTPVAIVIERMNEVSVLKLTNTLIDEETLSEFIVTNFS